MNLIKKIPNITKEEINKIDKLTRVFICIELKNKLLYLEKYSTTKDKNKMTYVIIPKDHPLYDFPYNLEDRVKDRINKINNMAGRKIDFSVNKTYEIKFKNEKFLDPIAKDLEKMNCKLNKNEWTLTLE
jgi:hypothetical protein